MFGRRQQCCVWLGIARVIFQHVHLPLLQKGKKKSSSAILYAILIDAETNSYVSFDMSLILHFHCISTSFYFTFHFFYVILLLFE
jgi:hypothetical protein